MEPVFDQAGAMKRVRNDLEFFKELYDLFIETLPEVMGEVTKAFQAGDMPRLGPAAHSVKSSLANLGAQRAWEAARNLEGAAHEKDAAGAATAYEQLNREIEEYKAAIASFLKQPA